MAFNRNAMDILYGDTGSGVIKCLSESDKVLLASKDIVNKLGEWDLSGNKIVYGDGIQSIVIEAFEIVPKNSVCPKGCTPEQYPHYILFDILKGP